MKYFFRFSEKSARQIRDIKNAPHLEKRYKAVSKALGFLKQNPRHPSLQTHVYAAFKGPSGEKVFEAYAEQDTPAAYRIFFYYGETKGEIVILAVTPHP